MANPTPNEVEASKSIWGGFSEWNPWDNLFGKSEPYTTKEKATPKTDTTKATAKVASKYTPDQEQFFRENSIIKDEDYQKEMERWVKRQIPAGLKQSEYDKQKAQLETKFRNTYQRASDFQHDLNVDNSGEFTASMAKKKAQEIGFPWKEGLSDAENTRAFNNWVTKQRSMGQDPFGVRNEWSDPRAVAAFLQGAAKSMGSFSTPETIFAAAKGGNKTYSRMSYTPTFGSSKIGG